ncbi:MAG: aquaporin family protein [Bacteroidetes bacterium]|nr:aquaporin family protein [Bacteroidota bacterium]
MSPFFGELIGTAILIILGDGVVANIALNKTKGNNSGLIVVGFGWAMAVYVAVFISSPYSSAHLNPAVTIGLAAAGKFEWAKVPTYIAAQMLGAIIGATVVWIAYRQHFNETKDGDTKLGVFCTAPAIRSSFNNLLTEIIATFVLIFGVLFLIGNVPTININERDGIIGLGSIGALPVALLVLGIGLSLGGPTGYAINPARDLGPRIAHFILPIPQKRDSDWGYAWVPVVGPIIGGIIAALLFKSL